MNFFSSEIFSNGTLFIRPFQDYFKPIHAGIYLCHAKNPAGIIQSFPVQIKPRSFCNKICFCWLLFSLIRNVWCIWNRSKKSIWIYSIISDYFLWNFTTHCQFLCQYNRLVRKSKRSNHWTWFTWVKLSNDLSSKSSFFLLFSQDLAINIICY